MTALPRVKGETLITALERAGFSVRCVRGSHHILKHADGRMTVVPVHAGETIGPGLLNRILRDCRLTREALRALL